MDSNFRFVKVELKITIFVLNILTILIGCQPIALIFLVMLPSDRLVNDFKIISQLLEFAHGHLDKRTSRVNMRRFGLMNMACMQLLSVIFDRLQLNAPVICANVFESNQSRLTLFYMTQVEISKRDRGHSIIILWVLVIETDFHANHFLIIE